MVKYVRPIEQVRIDLPLKETRLYWFVDPSHLELDPWWGRFLEFLLTFSSNELEWIISPTGDSAVSRPQLTRLQRADIVHFIRTAPERQIATHRTLRRAVEMTRVQEEGLELVYFSNDVVGLNSRIA